MLELKNTRVAFLEDSIVASGNAMTTGPINTDFLDIECDDMESHDRRAKSLGGVPSGTGHDNYLKGIRVMVDIKYPAYWTPEAQRYHWFDIVTSQSKMHRLSTALKDGGSCFNKYVDPLIMRIIDTMAEAFRDDPSYENRMRLLSNLPHGYEMWMTVSTNYLQLKTMYHQRKNHRLREDWGAFCAWCIELPRFRELTGIN
jgi:hypothetical protein